MFPMNKRAKIIEMLRDMVKSPADRVLYDKEHQVVVNDDIYKVDCQVERQTTRIIITDVFVGNKHKTYCELNRVTGAMTIQPLKPKNVTLIHDCVKAVVASIEESKMNWRQRINHRVTKRVRKLLGWK